MTSEHDPVAIARTTIATEIAGLTALSASIDGDFSKVVDLIVDCRGRVIVTGIGKSGHVGLKIAATFSSTGTPAYFIHAAEAAHGDLGLVGDEDVVLAISNSGESGELRAIVEYCRRFGVKLVVITSRPKSSLAKFADVVLRLPDAAEACPLALAPMTSTTMTLVLGDALAAALIRRRNFQAQDFAKFHPGGRLGAQLLPIAELVARDPRFTTVPTVSTDSDMGAVISSITGGRRGVTAVADADGRVVGVITDGDLRRALSDRGFFDRRARDIMTADPRRIGADRIAVEALALCEKHKISSIFVADRDDRIFALVHLQDLLELGIV